MSVDEAEPVVEREDPNVSTWMDTYAYLAYIFPTSLYIFSLVKSSNPFLSFKLVINN